MGYDQNTDYQKLINDEKAKGAAASNATLAALEASRNEKIAANGGSGTNQWGATYTYDYSTPSGATKLQSATSQADMINQLYTEKQRADLAALEGTYQQNLTDLAAAQAKIPAVYNSARNQTAATSEQNRAAFNEQAAANGINSGAGSQASLAIGNQLAGSMSSLNAKEADANTDIETQRLKVSQQYNAAVQQAIAEGSYQKAQALLGEAQRVDASLVAQSQAQAQLDYTYLTNQNALAQQSYEKLRTKAETLAVSGDFSGYKALGYTDAQIAQMYKTWAAQNPLLAATLNVK